MVYDRWIETKKYSPKEGKYWTVTRIRKSNQKPKIMKGTIQGIQTGKKVSLNKYKLKFKGTKVRT